MLRIIFPYLPPASFSGNDRRGFYARRGKKGDAQVIKNDLIGLLEEAGWNHKPIQFPEVRVTFVLDGRRRDHDNMVARMKPIWDGLVSLGVLVDDSLRMLGWPEYRDRKKKKGEDMHTILELWSKP
ncbi:MAG: hypothetical protein GWN86_07020 [Desulfobacterales bacterium]|nr:hypothetical protein [Desulfobacterales bacterium]